MAWATVKAFDAAGGPPGATLKGGGYRTTGSVKALARCDSIALHTFPSPSSDIRRAAPVHGQNSWLAVVDQCVEAAPLVGGERSGRRGPLPLAAQVNGGAGGAQ